MAADPRRVKELFVAALELTDDPARRAFLDRECAGDEELRRRLEALLHANDQPQPALDKPLAAVAPAEQDQMTTAAPAQDQAGAVLAGRYKLLERIGEGGMGTVWMAQQTEPVKRTVAVKLIKGGGDSKAVLARFEAERQALALMDHPNIAKVLDADTTENGQPFFVMELVKGVPITNYCDTHKLTPRHRLELFVPVCQAIQHAHQKGIIHRDLKPSNVLVALYDDRPVPKVIDFGVAKATAAPLTEATLVTNFGALVGTPQYMSPEQATLNNLDIDTRSDIYCLGVLLYELLAGSPPFRKKELEKAGMLEILRVIREEEPPKPSTKVSTADALPSLAANRSMEPARLSRQLRGEIDWIVMKALEKERARRYESANNLALDIQRYLADEPVLASPPSATYRLKKFVKRNKGSVLAAWLVLLALLVGIAGTTTGLIRAREAEAAAAADAAHAREAEKKATDNATAAREAEKKAKEKEEAARAAEKNTKEKEEAARNAEKKATESAATARAAEEKAKEEEKVAQAVNDFLRNDLLSLAGPTARADSHIAPDANIKMRTILDRAAASVSNKFQEQPLVEAAVRLTIGKAYKELGEFQTALPHMQRALEVFQDKRGRKHPETLRAALEVGEVLRHMGHYRRAEPLLSETLAACRIVLGDDEKDTLKTMNALATVYEEQGRYRLAEPLYREALQRRSRVLGEKHADTIMSRGNLGLLCQRLGKTEEAEKLTVQALEDSREVNGKEHPATLTAMMNLAMLYKMQERLDKAEPLAEQSAARQKTVFGDDHPATLTALNDLACVLEAALKYDRAEALYILVLEKRRKVLGDEHPDTLPSINNLGLLYYREAKYDKALALLEEGAKTGRRVLGDEHPAVLLLLHNLVHLYQFSNLGEAEKLARTVLKGMENVYGDEHRETLTAMNTLASIIEARGNLDEAEPLYVRCLDLRRTVLGENDPDTLVSLNNLALVYVKRNRLDKAEPMFKDALRAFTQVKGPKHPATALAMNNLGALYERQGQFDKAEPLYVDSLAIVRETASLPDPKVIAWSFALVRVYQARDKYDKAEPILVELATKGREKLGDDNPLTPGLLAQLGLNHLKRRQYAAAEPVLRDCLKIREKKLPDDWSTVNTKSMLGEALLGQEKYADAEPLLKDGYDGMKQRQDKIPEPVRKQRLSEALQRLVQLYEATDNKDEAARWRKELELLRDMPKQP
jgi:serine/threonine protein kinase